MSDEDKPLAGSGRLLIAAGVGFALCVLVGVGYAVSIMPEIRAQRRIKNEAAAVQSLIRIKTAQTLYRESAAKRYGSLEELEESRHLDAGHAGGPRLGYVFEAAPGPDPGSSWWAKASPQFPGKTGGRYFYLDQGGMVYESEADFPVPPPAAALPSEKLRPLGQ